MEIIIKVNSTYNNTIVSALYKGKILKTISTGSLGFKKAKRASTLAAQTCGEALGSWLSNLRFDQRLTPASIQDPLNKKNNSVVSLPGTDSIPHKKSIAEKTKKMDGENKIKNTLIGIKKQKGSISIKNVSLLISGVGYGKFGVIRGLAKLGVKIKTISEITNIPHNGCKPPKMRRK